MLLGETRQNRFVRGDDGRVSYARDDDAESPLRRARRLRFSVGFHALPASTQYHLRRVADVTKLTQPIADLLDREAAPLLVCRWIAWGRWLQDRAVRLGLVVLLREEARISAPGRSKSGWSWPDDRLFATAEKLFWESPQAARLVRAGVLVEQGKVPEQGGPLFTTLWDRTWTILQREIATIERATFLAQVHAVVSQRKRRRVRKRLKLTERDLAYVGALDTLKRGVLQGHITLDEVVHQSPRKKVKS